MKLAVLFRGPVRPSADIVNNNITFLTDSLSGHDITTYLWTWDTAEARKVRCDVNVYEEEPSSHFISKCVKHNIGNSFKQHWVMKRAIEFINGHDNHDFIVQARTDAKVIFDQGELPSWFDKDHYVTLHFYGIAPSYVNDQIGVATPEIMYKAWDYKDFGTLAAFTSNAKQVEDILDQTIAMNKVKLKAGKLTTHQLAENRHATCELCSLL